MMEAEKEAAMIAYVLRPASVLPREMSVRKFVQGLATSSKFSQDSLHFRLTPISLTQNLNCSSRSNV